MRKLYLFVDGMLLFNPPLLVWYALSDDGYVLAQDTLNINSSLSIKNTLHDEPHFIGVIKDHFKDEEYEILVLTNEQMKNNSGFLEALRLHGPNGCISASTISTRTLI